MGGVTARAGRRSLDSKALVVIAVECHDGRPGRTRMQKIPGASADVRTDFVLDNVARGSEVRTDGWRGYDHIGRHRFTHSVSSLRASGDPPTSLCLRSIASPACSSAGCSAPTRAQSATTSSSTTSTSSPSGSTAAGNATAACSSTGYWNKPSGPTRTATRCSKPETSHDQAPSTTGVPRWIANSTQIEDRRGGCGIGG